MTDPFSPAGRFEERRRDADQARAKAVMDLPLEKQVRLRELDKLIPMQEAEREKVADEMDRLSAKWTKMGEEIDALREERYGIKRGQR